MSLRVCLVTPFAWSQPHEVNEHVAACAEALGRLGHRVAILAPSNSARELAAGRRALRLLERRGRPLEGLVALGPAVPVSRKSSVGVPVGIRANLEFALSASGFDVIHAHEPGLPSLSYLALRDADALAVATFHSPERLTHPPAKKQRERLLARVDALTATSEPVAEAARARFPGDYRLLPLGIASSGAVPAAQEQRIVVEWSAEERATVRAALKALAGQPGWRIDVLRTRPRTGRPYVPSAVRDRVRVLTALDGRGRSAALAGAAALVAAPDGWERLRAEAAAAGVPVVIADSADAASEAVSAAAEGRLPAPAPSRDEGLDRLGRELDELYRSLQGRRRPRGPVDPLADRPWILADLHMHTEHSHDCSTPVADLLDHAEAIGLGAIAVTDHNVFAGAQDAVRLAAGRDLVVIPGEEVKTDRGEVIGLFIQEQIPRGMSMEETIAAIRDQGGLVYMPHPFDRLHAIPRPETLHRLLAEIDVFEVYNARLLFEGYNDEAVRFARKYNLLMGAGSDAHVLPGVGTGIVRMRAFETSEEFLISLRSAEIVRRPKSLLYLQGLKWVAQARERRGRAAARDTRRIRTR